MKRKAPQKVVVNKFKRKKIYFELKRKSVHVFLGALISFLIFKNWFSVPFWIFILSLGMYASYLLKHNKKIPLLHNFIVSLERKKELKKAPLKGALLFLVGCILSYIIFDSQIAIAAILTLIVGDTVAAFYGTYFGKIKSPTDSQKHLDAAFAAIIINTVFLSLLLSFSFGVIFLASAITFLLESLIPFSKMEKGILGLFFNDNILIPLVFGLVLFFV